MNEERILKEIDSAARMGIDVFVIDTGWYVKTGDWRVNTDRFAENLRAVRKRLDEHGMKLGLWFDPTAAALSSEVARKHRDCVQTRGGQEPPLREIWGTEESHTMCLVSRYTDSFADELIRLASETGVTYFKWDAIQQYGCDSPGHDHGTEINSPQERAECFAFELPRAMGRIAGRLSEHCPQTIVDFDVTEPARPVGLGFLASGKFFLINNGPYYHNYDLPTPPPGNKNMFFYPGPARPRICRTPLGFDKWIPSVLFLTHYFPDDPESSQIVNLASLILGQNGIWGDLTGVSEEGVERIARIVSLYKQVRDDITASFPVRTGAVGGSPEVHEKISHTARGVICCFADARGEYEYVSQNKVDRRCWATDGTEVEFGPTGRAKLKLSFDDPGAHIVFFGIESP
jgi:alpha-galactosidase